MQVPTSKVMVDADKALAAKVSAITENSLKKLTWDITLSSRLSEKFS
jgi:hypothetical protein